MHGGRRAEGFQTPGDTMSLLDILNQYAGNAQPQADTAAHFDATAQQASTGDLGNALAAMFRSDATPAFGQQIGDLFSRSNPLQQAGLLNQILQSAGPSALGAAGGVLGRVLGPGAGGGGIPTVTPEQASQLSPADVQAIANHAQQHDPSIIDRAGAFYAEHPTLVKSLGMAALALTMNQMRSMI
jgi:hypothetical protein